MQDKREPSALRNKILNIVSIVLCVILVPILIVNCTLIVKGVVNEDKYPTFAGLAPMIVQTGSMEDVFPAGSIIFIKSIDSSDVAEGDIISYFDPYLKNNKVTTHKVRFIKVNSKGNLEFYTYGTANPGNVGKTFEEITEKDCEVIPAENLIGRYTGVSFAGLGNAAIFMQSTPGLIVCVFVPLALLVGYDIIRRRLYEKKHEEDKDELMRELEELRKLKEQNQNKD